MDRPSSDQAGVELGGGAEGGEAEQPVATRLMDETEARARALELTGVVLSTEPCMRAVYRLYEARLPAAARARLAGGRFVLLAYRLALP